MFSLESTSAVWKMFYCDDDEGWKGCERFVRFGRGEEVPPQLLPNGELIPKRKS